MSYILECTAIQQSRSLLCLFKSWKLSVWEGLEDIFDAETAWSVRVEVRIGKRKRAKIDYIKVFSICKTRRNLLSEYSRYVL